MICTLLNMQLYPDIYHEPHDMYQEPNLDEFMYGIATGILILILIRRDTVQLYPDIYHEPHDMYVEPNIV